MYGQGWGYRKSTRTKSNKAEAKRSITLSSFHFSYIIFKWVSNKRRICNNLYFQWMISETSKCLRVSRQWDVLLLWLFASLAGFFIYLFGLGTLKVIIIIIIILACHMLTFDVLDWILPKQTKASCGQCSFTPHGNVDVTAGSSTARELLTK